MRILVVDDEYVSRMKLKSLLSLQGQTEATDCGENALRMIKEAHEQGRPFDLITLDIDMPGMTGTELLQKIRRWEQSQPGTKDHQAQVLMVTGVNNPREVMSSFREGAEWYLLKPVTPENLADSLTKVQGETPPAKTQAPPAPPAEQTPPAAVAPATDDAPPQASGNCSLTLPDPSGIDCGGVDPEFWAEYISSTVDKLAELQGAAMELEAGNDIEAASDSIMRLLHSLKGEAGMIGLTDVQNVCHEAEDLFKEEGGQPDSADMVLKVKDWIEAATQQAGNLVTAGSAGK